MADLIKKIKIKKQDGTFTDYIPIGAEAQNISTSDGDSVQLKLGKKPYYYNSIADMKTDTKLKVGDMVITLGYYEANDGGNGEYVIVNDNTLVDDGGSIHVLTNGLRALLINNRSYVIPEQFGAYGDYSSDSEYHDDKNAIQSCIDYATLNHYDIQFLYKVYYVSDSIYLRDNNPNINGNNAKIYSDTSTAIISMIDGDVLRYACIENLSIVGNDSESSIGMLVSAGYTTFRHLNISHVATGFKMKHQSVPGNLVGNRYEDLGIRKCTIYSMYLGDSDNNKITDGWITDCAFTGNPDVHIYIGSCVGYKIENIHTSGGGDIPYSLRNCSRTNINNIYMENYHTRGFSLLLARDVNISNVTVKSNYDDSILFRIETTNTVRKRNVNISNVFVDTNDGTEPTNTVIVSGINNLTVDVFITNLKVALSSYILKPSNLTKIHVHNLQDEVPTTLLLNDFDFTTYTSLISYVSSLATGIYYLSGASSYLAGFSDMPTGALSTGYSNITINKITNLQNSIIQMCQHVSGDSKYYIGYYNSNTQTVTGWKEITLS